mgnify:CR=1 FL=1
MVPLSLTFLLLMSFPSPVKPALLKGSAFSRLYLCLISHPVTPSKTRYTLSLVKRTLERQDRTLPTWYQHLCFTPFPGAESVLLIALWAPPPPFSSHRKLTNLVLISFYTAAERSGILPFEPENLIFISSIMSILTSPEQSNLTNRGKNSALNFSSIINRGTDVQNSS